MINTTDVWKNIVKSNKRYADFTILEKSKRFNEMFAGQNIPCVQLHSTELLSDLSDIVGFCGTFGWKDGILTPLDGDSYAEDMSVLGYNWFTNENGEKCLNVLVGDDW